MHRRDNRRHDSRDNLTKTSLVINATARRKYADQSCRLPRCDFRIDATVVSVLSCSFE